MDCKNWQGMCIKYEEESTEHSRISSRFKFNNLELSPLSGFKSVQSFEAYGECYSPNV